MSANWYVLSIKPHKEQPVHRYLESQQIEAYLPTMRVSPVNPRSRRARPFFPGYMFVYVDLSIEGDNCLRWIPGARGLVRFGNQPAVVPENLISELRKRLQALNEAARNGNHNKLQKGDRVRIIKGPFEGYEAIFDAHLSGRDRVQVLLNFLNEYPHRMRMSISDIEKIT